MPLYPLVSVISPCYNGEKYVIPFFESILAQDYPNIELIFVNDGSVDKTEEIALLYGEKLKERGFKFIYIYQENAGQAAAINRGLAIFSGEFVMWMDSDDIMYPKHISEKVCYLEEHPDFGFVLAEGEVVAQHDLNKRKGVLKREISKGADNLFSDLIYERNVVFCPGTIMVRRSELLRAIPSREIFASREGQNWQLMLPIAYISKCGYLKKVLFKYVEHADSHSRMRRSYSAQVSRREAFEELINETIRRIESMPASEKEVWYERVKIKTLVNKMSVAYRYLKFRDIALCRKQLKRLGHSITWKETFLYFWTKTILRKLRRLLF